MKIGFGLLAFGVIINLISYVAHAEAFHCEVQKVAKCACKASMSVVCHGPDGSAVSGNIDDAQKPDTVDYQCGAVSGTLAHPKYTTHAYVTEDAEFKTDAALHDKPVSSASQCSFKAFTADSAKLKLFKEADALNKIDLTTCAWVSTQAGGLFASAAHGNLLKVSASCKSPMKSTNFCAGQISCNGKAPTYRVCETTSDLACPSAQECFDKSTIVGNPHKFTISTVLPRDPKARDYSNGNLATVSSSDGQLLCLGQYTANGKTIDLACPGKKASCEAPAACAVEKCADNISSFVSVSGRVYEANDQEVTLISTTKIAWKFPKSLLVSGFEPRTGQSIIVQGKSSEIKLIPVPKD